MTITVSNILNLYVWYPIFGPNVLSLVTKGSYEGPPRHRVSPVVLEDHVLPYVSGKPYKGSCDHAIYEKFKVTSVRMNYNELGRKRV